MAARAEGVIRAYPLLQAEGGGANPTSALSLRIEEIPMRFARELNTAWHSMLPRTDLGNLLCGTTSVAYGALYDNNWYAVAIWTQPIIASLCDGATIELRRLAICNAAPKNTASRMLRIMCSLVAKRWPHIHRFISYQAIAVHRGTIYRAAGWQQVTTPTPARPQRFSNVNKNTRATGPQQTTSAKVRWERRLYGK